MNGSLVPACAYWQEMVWWTESNFLGFYPKVVRTMRLQDWYFPSNSKKFLISTQASVPFLCVHVHKYAYKKNELKALSCSFCPSAGVSNVCKAKCTAPYSKQRTQNVFFQSGTPPPSVYLGRHVIHVIKWTRHFCTLQKLHGQWEDLGTRLNLPSTIYLSLGDLFLQTQSSLTCPETLGS